MSRYYILLNTVEPVIFEASISEHNVVVRFRSVRLRYSVPEDRAYIHIYTGIDDYEIKVDPGEDTNFILDQIEIYLQTSKILHEE